MTFIYASGDVDNILLIELSYVLCGTVITKFEAEKQFDR